MRLPIRDHSDQHQTFTHIQTRHCGAKRLAKGHNNRDWDGAGFELPTSRLLDDPMKAPNFTFICTFDFLTDAWLGPDKHLRLIKKKNPNKRSSPPPQSAHRIEKSVLYSGSRLANPALHFLFLPPTSCSYLPLL